MTSVKSDLEIASLAKKKPITEIASSIGIDENGLILYGNDKAKITYDFLDKTTKNKDGKLILVTAISPTPAGEGKTTTSVGPVSYTHLTLPTTVIV